MNLTTAPRARRCSWRGRLRRSTACGVAACAWRFAQWGSNRLEGGARALAGACARDTTIRRWRRMWPLWRMELHVSQAPIRSSRCWQPGPTRACSLRARSIGARTLSCFMRRAGSSSGPGLWVLGSSRALEHAKQLYRRSLGFSRSTLRLQGRRTITGAFVQSRETLPGTSCLTQFTVWDLNSFVTPPMPIRRHGILLLSTLPR